MFVVVWVFRILALAFFAVGGFDTSTLDGAITAVAAIELAATIVVLIVAVTIADVVRMRALLLTFLVFRVFRILALTFFAVGCFDTPTLD